MGEGESTAFKILPDKPIKTSAEFSKVLRQWSDSHFPLSLISTQLKELKLEISSKEATECVADFLKYTSQRYQDNAYTTREGKAIPSHLQYSLFKLQLAADFPDIKQTQKILAASLDNFAKDIAQEHILQPQEISSFVEEKLKKLHIQPDKEWKVRDIFMHYPNQGKTGQKHMVHSVLREVLKQAGAEITVGGEEKNHKGLRVFTRDAVIADHIHKKVYLPGFPGDGMVKEMHRADQKHSQKFYTDRGYKVVKIDYLNTEGGDIQPYLHNKGEREGLWIASYAQDTDRDNLQRFAREQNLEILLLPQAVRSKEKKEETTQRQDDRFYHLDTFFSALPNGEVLIYEPATTVEARTALKQRLGEKNYISISEEDAVDMATNLESVGNILVMPHCSHNLQKTLEGKGYQIITPEKLGLPKGSFKFQNGATHCMTNELSLDDKALKGIEMAKELFDSAWNKPDSATLSTSLPPSKNRGFQLS